ncbi:MAG: hypothetical protein AVDCRST_MAG26-2227, partial [uncultured Chloroflexia bacterium]
MLPISVCWMMRTLVLLDVGESGMDEPMTKARLIETLQTRRAKWDAALAQVPQDRMTQP